MVKGRNRKNRQKHKKLRDGFLSLLHSGPEQIMWSYSYSMSHLETEKVLQVCMAEGMDKGFIKTSGHLIQICHVTLA